MGQLWCQTSVGCKGARGDAAGGWVVGSRRPQGGHYQADRRALPLQQQWRTSADPSHAARCASCHITSLRPSPPQVLENNYRLKMMYSPDYKGVDTEQALAVRGRGCCCVRRQYVPGGEGEGVASHWRGRRRRTLTTARCGAPPCPFQDFRARIRKYEDGYETIMDRTLHYIKLIDMVTGRAARCRLASHPDHTCTTPTPPALPLAPHPPPPTPPPPPPHPTCTRDPRSRLHGCEPHLGIPPRQDGLLPHAGEQGCRQAPCT